MAILTSTRFDLRRPGLALGVLVLPLLAGCEAEKPVAAPPPPPPEVVLAEVTKQTVPIILQASGTVQAVKNVKIIPRVSGYIFERFYTEGTFVKKDDPLYLIDPRPFEDRLNQLKAQLKRHRATVTFLESEEKRQATLFERGFTPAEKLERVRSELAQTLAQIEETQVEIKNAELNLSYTRINAPFDGRVEETKINVGNLVTEQQDVLTDLVLMDPIYVIFNLSRSQGFEIQKLQSQGQGFLSKDMVVEILLPDGQAYAEMGKLDFVSYLIDPTTDSIEVRGIFKNTMLANGTTFQLIPGQYVPVRLTAGEMPDALVIPQTAMVSSQVGTYVYVVGDDNKAKLRFIKLGDTHKDLVVVTEGLKEGEKVVNAGVQKVKDGIEVKPTAPATSDPAAKPEPEQKPVSAAEPGQTDQEAKAGESATPSQSQ